MPGGGGGSTPQQFPPQVIETGGTTESTSTTQLSPEALALQQRAAANQEAYHNNIANSISGPGPFYYPGEIAAPIAPQSLLSNALTTQTFTDPRTYAAQPLAQLSQLYAQSPGATNALAQQSALQGYMATPQFLDPRSNPFTAAAADAANRQTVSTLANQVLPQIKSSAVSAGQFGGSREGIAQGQAIAGAAQAIADTTAKQFFDSYQSNIDASLKAQALAPGTALAPQQLIQNAIAARGEANNQMLRNFAALDTAGLQLQQHAQQLVEGETQRWMFNNTIGLQELSIYAGISGALTDPASYGAGSSTASSGISSGTQTTTGGPGSYMPYTSPLLGAVGGAAAGAAVGGVPGAIIGGLVGLFSA